MASPVYREWRRCPYRQPTHHHHHHCLLHHRHHYHHHCCHFFPPCAHYNHHLHSPFQGNLNLSLPLPQKPDSFTLFPIRNNSDVVAVENQEADSSAAAQISQELEHLELDEEEDDDDEPIFVLTDEWRDFFAKSEAKRRLEKKQSKKGKKKM